MPPKYRITYFEDEGRAEPARQMLEIAGADWEDVRLTQQQWADYKPKTIFKQLPVMEELESGYKLAQSNAINRYLANKFGLAGKTPEDRGRADMVMEAITDFVKPMEDIYLEKDETHKKKLLEAFTSEGLERHVRQFDEVLRENKDGDGFFVGDEITVADILFYEVIGWPALVGLTTPYDKYPKLKALKDRVDANPAIAAWLKKRPKRAI